MLALRAISKKVAKVLPLLLLIFIYTDTLAQNPLNKKISLNVTKVSLEKALKRISQEGDFNFSYNSDILPLDSLVTVKAQNQPVEVVLKRLIDRPDIRYRAHNTYIIIYQDPVRKQEQQLYTYTITGYIQNGRTGEIIPYASIYEMRANNYVLADASGKFSLKVTTSKDQVGLAVSKKDYLDTVIIVKPVLKSDINIELTPRGDQLQPLDYRAPEMINYETETVEEIGIVSFFVSQKQQYHAQNITTGYDRYAQVSFIPFLGTNGFRSGNYINYLSLNILAGYNKGLAGVEVGGLLNINRQKTSGLQIAGLGNVVGGKMYGLQIAGFFNTTLRSVYGIQLAGFNNYAQDTVYGFQIAGFNNMLVGRMKGAQISGFNNIATREFDGVQVSGFSNLAIKGVVRTQAGGFFNYAQKVTGLQASGFANVGVKKVYGLQAAGFANYAQSPTGAQVAGFLNIGTGDVTGGQVGFINYATRLKGVQIGFLNISDSVRGIPIGFISYVHKGYHHLQITGNENLFFQGSFKTGVDKFYNILSAGAYLQGNESAWSFGYGVGTAHTFGRRVEINLDATANTLFKDFETIPQLNILGQVDLQVAFKFRDYLSVFAGPTLNMLLLDTKDGEVPAAFLQNYPPYVQDERLLFDRNLRSWIGWKAGIRI